MHDVDPPSGPPEPIARTVPHRWGRPSGPVDDPYAWLRDRDDPETIAYLQAENAYCDAWFADRAALVDELFGEIRSRVQEDDVSAPVRKGEWYYASQTHEGQSYPTHSRGRTAAMATDDVLLDQNVEADGHDFFDLAAFEISPDHGRLAWSADTAGDEHFTLRIRDLGRGVDLDDEVHDTTYAGVAWSADGRFVFYVAPDDQERPFRVMRHEVGTGQSDDVEVYRDDDERFFVGVEATRSGQWIVIGSVSKTSSEFALIPAAAPTSAPTVVRPRVADVEYRVDHWVDRFVILTNDDAVDFRVMEASLGDPGEWTELVPHEPGRRIVTIEPFAGHLALLEWREAQPQVRVVTGDGADRLLDIDPEPHDIEFGHNEEWLTSVVRLTHQSLTSPARVIDVGLDDGDITVVKQMPTPNVDLGDYTATRRWATAADGTKVPVDVVRHVDTPVDGTAPCCVYGYGSYEVSLPPWFSVARLSLLDRGVVWALVHPRGGGELGRQWYLDGKLLSKRNTFTDTLAATDHLVDVGVAHPERLAIRGGSAGGLLVGACITMRPERYAAAVAEVPFVDVTTTMSDPTLPLTVTEWEEWGDPRDEPHASYIAGYSPYDNTVAADYPAVYVTAGLNDPRVSFHEPAKWTAKLRSARTNDALVLLHTEMGAGHAGPSGRYDAWRDEAKVIAFLLDALG
ncbi:MAG: S9 family peptidase [Acidimicrobiales bacterium]